MRRPADSLVLALANLIAIGFLHVARRGSLPALAALVSVPALLLLTMIFALKDRRKPENRAQAWVALVLAIPSIVLLLFMRF